MTSSIANNRKEIHILILCIRVNSVTYREWVLGGHLVQLIGSDMALVYCTVGLLTRAMDNRYNHVHMHH